MKPTWDKLADEFNSGSKVLVADVDCTAGGKDLCETYGVQGFPTIKYFNPPDEEGEDYENFPNLAARIGAFVDSSLTELKGIVVQPFRFVASFLLQSQPLAANGFQFLQALLATGLMLLEVLTLQFNGFLLKLLTSLQSLLLQLLTSGGKLLLLLDQFGLHLLFHGSVLLTGGLQ